MDFHWMEFEKANKFRKMRIFLADTVSTLRYWQSLAMSWQPWSNLALMSGISLELCYELLQAWSS
jgi:hypothetical protein